MRRDAEKRVHRAVADQPRRERNQPDEPPRRVRAEEHRSDEHASDDDPGDAICDSFVQRHVCEPPAWNEATYEQASGFEHHVHQAPVGSPVCFNVAMILSATSRATALRSSSGTSSTRKTSVYFLYRGSAST